MLQQRELSVSVNTKLARTEVSFYAQVVADDGIAQDEQPRYNKGQLYFRMRFIKHN